MTKDEQAALDLIMEGAEALGWTIAIGGNENSDEPVPYLIIGLDDHVETIIRFIDKARGYSNGDVQ